MLMAYGTFGNVGNLWCCWMNFVLDFGGIGIVKILCCKLAWTYSWYMCEILLACVNFISWTWQNFCGYGKFSWIWKNFYGHEILVMEKFCWVYDVGSWKILWLWFWICGNLFVHGHGHVEFFFDGYLGHVGIFSWWLFWTCREFFGCAWLWEKFDSCVWTCEKIFDCGKIFGGGIVFFVFWLWEFLDMWFWSWKFFWTCDFGHGIMG